MITLTRDVPQRRSQRFPVQAAVPAVVHAPIAPFSPIELGRYQARLARSGAERQAACHLRFRVFNLEMGEGLESSYSTGLDEDRYDHVCEHLIVEDKSTRAIVGTYRMQSGLQAAEHLGYYSAQEFHFEPFEKLRPTVLELGRASIDREHRSSEVLTLLWRGIGQYARLNGLRYLVGCSSLTSHDPDAGWAVYEQLDSFLVAEEYRSSPTPLYALPRRQGVPATLPKVPKLLRTYIGIGAKICGAPAWDVEFGTIDFLTLLDLEQITPAARSRFLLDTQ